MPDNDALRFVLMLFAIFAVTIGTLFVVNRVFEYKEYKKSAEWKRTPFDLEQHIGPFSKYLPPVSGCKCGCVEYSAETNARAEKFFDDMKIFAQNDMKLTESLFQKNRDDNVMKTAEEALDDNETRIQKRFESN